jgi:hypothetical protein
VERELVRIWEQVLQRAPIGIQEDFFDWGGTSVQAAHSSARIEETFHKRLPLSVILGAPTIEQVAASPLPGESSALPPSRRNVESRPANNFKCCPENLAGDYPSQGV